MRSLVLAGVLITAGIKAQSQANKMEVQPRAYVSLSGGHIIQELIVVRAQLIAAQIFSDIGLPLVWGAEKRRGFKPLPGTCEAAPAIIGISLQEGPNRVLPSILAQARLSTRSGDSITLFYSPLRQRFRSNPSFAAAILAYVFAHEIAHILQGVSRHAETGVMKAFWTEDDYTHMGGRTLRFSPADVELIHAGTASKRVSGCGAPAHEPIWQESRGIL